MLPNLIEYLSSLRRPGGGRLARPGRTQFNILLTPNQQLNTIFNPAFGAYAAIKWGLAMDTPPGAISLQVNQSGEIYTDGNIESDLMREIVPYFILFTTAQPIYVIFRNLTALNQRLIGTQWHLIITSQEDLVEISEQIRLYQGAFNTNLLNETNALLRQIDAHLTRPVLPRSMP